ncbi:diadenylate cyclase CdaA [Caldicellulosiruptoraceae bacterium PP1]
MLTNIYYDFVDLLRNLSLIRITIFDIVDIAIVSFVVYKLIMLIRDTRAYQLVKGIVILLLITQISKWLKLNIINWLLTNTLSYGVLALLIVFQPELRRALEQIGRSKIWGKLFSLEGEENKIKWQNSIEEIIKALLYLSKNKIGALIVVEGDTKIGEIINTGIIIDSEISSQLLINIFIPNTPLHDGAVVIRDGKIKAAACFLPLSENRYISKELGTRHRAALGITENSDATAIVVSEETGIISVAYNGGLTRNLNTESLRKILSRPLKNEKNKNSFFKWRR